MAQFSLDFNETESSTNTVRAQFSSIPTEHFSLAPVECLDYIAKIYQMGAISSRGVI